MTNVWVYKADGTTQCNSDPGISLEDMQEELSKYVGAKNIVSSEKRHLPKLGIALCGAATGSVNAYELTEMGAYVLFRGFIGPMGFALWVWGEASNDKLSHGFVLGTTKLSGDGESFPVSLIKNADAEVSPSIFLNFVAALTQSGSQPTSISELTGRHCRCYHQGDSLTLDYLPMRVNIELDKGNTIQRIWFG